jgi:hypothetical protein
MAETNSENKSGAGPATAAKGPEYQDWREQRWEWRRQKREARRRYPYHGLFPGMVLILIGGLFLSVQQGWISGSTWWQYGLIGLGIISLINGIFHYSSPEYRYWGRGSFIWGTALVAVGVLFLLGFSQWWPLVLIGIGIAVLLRFLW